MPFLKLRHGAVVRCPSLNIILPTLLHVNHYVTLKKRREQKQRGENWRRRRRAAECRWGAVGGVGGTVYWSSFESANHSEGEHQLVRFFPTRGRKNERREGRVHMKAVEINTSLSPEQICDFSSSADFFCYATSSSVNVHVFVCVHTLHVSNK